jgi:hypothetical protein
MSFAMLSLAFNLKDLDLSLFGDLAKGIIAILIGL